MIKHKGRGSYDVMVGEAVIASGLSKEAAQAKAAEVGLTEVVKAPRKAWLDLAAMLDQVEREEAVHGLRIVTVAADADRLPAEDRDGLRVHPGRFGGWLVREATFEDPSLVAVIGLSDGSAVGLTEGGDVVEVVHG